MNIRSTSTHASGTCEHTSIIHRQINDTRKNCTNFIFIQNANWQFWQFWHNISECVRVCACVCVVYGPVFISLYTSINTYIFIPYIIYHHRMIEFKFVFQPSSKRTIFNSKWKLSLIMIVWIKCYNRKYVIENGPRTKRKLFERNE